jgi:TRAP-type C4-dicarboxylate transport system permease small subunit
MNWATRITIWIGGVALLGATLADTVAVIGRKIGLPLHGSIELVQLCVLVAGAIALLLSTLAGSHAKVHLVVDRLGDRWRDAALRGNSLLAAGFFIALLVGSAWLAVDLWNGHEQSELLGIPWRWMRMLANLCFAAIIVLLLRQAFGRRQP